MATDHLDQVRAVKALPKGTILTAGMLEGAPQKKGLIGQQLSRPIFAGKEVTLEDVRPPDLVARQSQVTIEFRRGGLILSMPGRALKPGGYGEMVPVLMEGRRKPIPAMVIGAAKVEIRS
ncbi:MAG: flagellar basal body P-ring formation chaperone FlgA [Pseudomonadota bacterium]